ncbi:hypothetical protein [Caballeronia sp. 15711]|uniref:hypothetical protein n=1 Tax=Caballeronia sp. 15711 TaxID=3391029 RepID=UPI0039E5D0F3
MAHLFFPTSADSVTCKRCGNDIPSDADMCPHCGADHGPVGPDSSAAKTTALSTNLRLPFGARREVLNVSPPYPSMTDESRLAGTGEPRWDVSRTITLGAVALVLVAGGVIYSQRGSSRVDTATHSETPAEHSAYGVIDMKTAHDTPAPTAPPARSAAAATAMTTRQAQTAAAPSVAAREALPTDTSSRAATPLASATDNLQAARDAITRGDLTTARRRFSKIPASQLSAANVQQTQADLTSLEHARDEMLRAAHSCEAIGSWLCVRQNARVVLTIDASNAEAQTLVEHAIARSGWLNKPAPAPATTAAHGGHHNNANTAAVTPAPMDAPAPRVAATVAPASTHKPAVSVSAAEHARAVAAMGVPTPIQTPLAAAPVAPTVVTTKRSPVAARAAPEAARVSTGSQAPLTSAATGTPLLQEAAPSRSAAPAFVPMPDGPDAMPATALVGNPPATAAQIPSDTASPTSTRPLAPVSEAAPVRAGIVSPPVARTAASGRNLTSAAPMHVPAFNSTNADEEERAILESGWSKSPSPAQRSTPQ